MVTATRQSLLQKYGIDAADLQTRLKWVGFTDEDGEYIRRASEYLMPEAETIARDFYEHSFKFPAFVAKADEAGTNRGRLEGAQAGYFKGVLEGRPDAQSVERALFIGENHTKLDVKPRWVIGNFATYTQLIFPRLGQHLEGEDLVNTIIAFSKVFSLDASLFIESYMGGLMDRMVDVFDRLGPAAASMAEGSEQVNSAADEIAKAIQGVAESASSQTNSVNEAVNASQSMSTALAQVAEASRASGERSQESLEAAEEGKRAAFETAEAMQGINDAVVATSSQIEELNETGKEIGAITEAISEIAGQTNLLALNAAIEAARAGDMGRGFAVVADEVRTLAERSASAAKDIAALIEKVQTGVGRSVEAMNGVVNDVGEGKEKAQQAGDVLNRIVESSQELSRSVSSIEQSTKSANGASDELAGSMDQMGSLAESNAALSEEVAASVEEVTAQMGEMASRADELNSVAGELSEFLTWIGALERSNTAGSAAA